MGDAAQPDSDVIDDLATTLFALETGTLPTDAVTALITREIVKWAVRRGWTARTEARVMLPQGPAGAIRAGFVDVIVRRGDGTPDLAIEIDSADKPWSVTKLRYAVAGGMHAVWIRWGDHEWAGIYDDVDVIQLPVARKPGSRRISDDQLAFW